MKYFLKVKQAANKLRSLTSADAKPPATATEQEGPEGISFLTAMRYACADIKEAVKELNESVDNPESEKKETESAGVNVAGWLEESFDKVQELIMGFSLPEIRMTWYECKNELLDILKNIESNIAAANKAAEDIIDRHLKKALDAIENEDLSDVENWLLTLKPELRKASFLFKENEKEEPGQEGCPYAVVITYSFDPNMRVVAARNYEEAYAFMEKDFLEEKRIDEEENGYEIGDSTEITPTSAILETMYPSETGNTCWSIIKMESN